MNYYQKYGKKYYEKNKKRHRQWCKKWINKNKKRIRIYAREWTRKNKKRLNTLRQLPENREKIRKRNHDYYINHEKGKPHFIKRKIANNLAWKKRNPVTALLVKRLSLIKQRCINPRYHGYKYYGGRGIKCLLSLSDMKLIWQRDKAHLMDKPSVDRINNDGHYELSNCRFLEMRLNLPHKKVKNTKN